MGKRIIICLNPFESHFIPTIALTKHLIDMNHFVIYMGFAFMEKTVWNRGFSCISLTSCTNAEIQQLQETKAYHVLETVYKKLHKEVEGYLAQYRPDIVLMGISRYHFYLIPALSYGAKVYFYSLCGGVPYINSLSPPITSDYINTFQKFQRVINVYTWFKRLLRKGLNINVLIERRFYPWTIMRSLCRKMKIKWKFGIDGFFADFPILVLGSKYLEFSDVNGLSYLGLGVIDSPENRSVGHRVSPKPLIYCSLGTMNHRYRKAERFYTALIALFREMPQWDLILSIGKNIKFDKKQLPSNVTVYEFAPQLSILEKADLMITHGGYGTVKECVKYAVPMLVLPCSYDQRGNAARIHFHQIGIRDLLLEITPFEKRLGINLKEITPQHIRELIEKVLLNPVYKANVINMSKKIENANELVEECKKLF